MRGKRSKQYRKLMKSFQRHFGFREPYQVLVDSGMIEDSSRFKMELVPALERTLHGQVKPMITQCSIRQLYKRTNEPGMDKVIELAKTFERRRCGHLPEKYPEPLSNFDCLTSVVDEKDTGNNKHRYVVASQEAELRRKLREVKGVPLIYIARSVMIMEPVASATMRAMQKEERSKFKAELQSLGTGTKRKRGDDDDDDDDDDGDDSRSEKSAPAIHTEKKKKTPRGPKGPNPLSVKKSKKKSQADQVPVKLSEPAGAESSETRPKKKRKRKHKKTAEDGQDHGSTVESAAGEED